MELVNGYQCRNCTDVDYAKRNIDPQHPKDGPFGINKRESPDRGPAVVLAGSLDKSGAAAGAANANGIAAVTRAASVTGAPSADNRPGRRIDLSV